MRDIEGVDLFKGIPKYVNSPTDNMLFILFFTAGIITTHSISRELSHRGCRTFLLYDSVRSTLRNSKSAGG